MNGEAHGTGRAIDGRRNMSTTSSPDPGAGTPLTRRQRRALERAQQAQQEALTQDLPALSQPVAQTRPAGTPSTSAHPAGTPAPHAEVQPQGRPQAAGRAPVPTQNSSHRGRPVASAPVSAAPRVSSHDLHSASMPPARADRHDPADEPGHPLDEAITGTQEQLRFMSILLMLFL